MTVAASGEDPRHIFLAKLAAIAGAYYVSAKVGLDLAFETSSVTAIWPPTGLALAAMVLWGPRVWPGVALGAFLANAWTGVPVGTVLGITTGNTLEAVVGALLLRRVGFRPSLDRVWDVLYLVVLAAGISTVVSATIGVGSLLIGDEIEWGQAGTTWRTWWFGDMGGDLLVAPFVMVAATHWPFRRAPGHAAEALALALAIVAAGVLVFLPDDTNVAYLVFPLLVWAALRFWQPGAAAASLAVATIAVLFTANDSGPFVRSNPDESLLLAQSFFGVYGITVLVVAAVITERRRAEEVTEHIAQTLQESLLPSRLPEIPEIDAAARFRPAGGRYRVGGDFYDVFAVGPKSWAVVVGDVSGKGPDAAAVTALARYTLREAASHEDRPSRVLGLLNSAILRQRARREFCAVAYARLDLDHGSGARLTLAPGGSPLPLLLRARGGVEPIGRPGTLVGVDAELQIADTTIDLDPGDVLLFYTDGLTDAFAPEHTFTADELETLLAACDGLDAAGVADRVITGVLDSSAAEPRDDIALVVLRIAPAP